MKNTSRWLVAAAIMIALFQASLIASRIVAYEGILSNGTRLLFKTAPVDPYDLFRGRYVALSQGILTIEIPEEEAMEYGRGESAWVGIATGEDGYSTFDRISRTPRGGLEVKVKVAWAGPRYEPAPKDAVGPERGPKKWVVNIKPPFDRYYVNEKYAAQVEAAARARTEGKVNPYISVRVRDGLGVIEELYIEGKPVKDWIRERQDPR